MILALYCLFVPLSVYKTNLNCSQKSFIFMQSGKSTKLFSLNEKINFKLITCFLGIFFGNFSLSGGGGGCWQMAEEDMSSRLHD